MAGADREKLFGLLAGAGIDRFGQDLMVMALAGAGGQPWMFSPAPGVVELEWEFPTRRRVLIADRGRSVTVCDGPGEGRQVSWFRLSRLLAADAA